VGLAHLGVLLLLQVAAQPAHNIDHVDTRAEHVTGDLSSCLHERSWRLGHVDRADSRLGWPRVTEDKLDTTGDESPRLWKAPDAASCGRALMCRSGAPGGTHSGDALCARSVRVVGAQIGRSVRRRQGLTA
jgi:hypothetical protein